MWYGADCLDVRGTFRAVLRQNYRQFGDGPFDCVLLCLCCLVIGISARVLLFVVVLGSCFVAVVCEFLLYVSSHCVLFVGH